MSDESTQSRWVRHAERNDVGDLIYTREREGRTGRSQTVEINVSAMNQPGDRRTGNHDILRLEAELVADGVDLKNCAKPTSGEVAQAHAEWCDANDLQPAWELCDYPGWEP